jgi:peptide deformylase
MPETASKLKIITFGHPTLRVRCEPVTVFDDKLRQLAEDMHVTMVENEGIGLAASQVNRRIRLLVICVPVKDTDEIIRLSVVNPEVLESRGSWDYEEGCLSIPDVRDTVTRPEWIKLKYQDLDGREHLVELSGLPGRVVQHELDHLNGVLFVDHLSPVRRALHSGTLKRLVRENSDRS